VPEVHHGLCQAKVFITEEKTFRNLSLYEQRITRIIHKNLEQLLKYQLLRKAGKRTSPMANTEIKHPQPIPLTRFATAADDPNGFAFSDAPEAAAAAPNSAGPPLEKVA